VSRYKRVQGQTQSAGVSREQAVECGSKFPPREQGGRGAGHQPTDHVAAKDVEQIDVPVPKIDCRSFEHIGTNTRTGNEALDGDKSAMALSLNPDQGAMECHSEY
jgi:hypothetical protein